MKKIVKISKSILNSGNVQLSYGADPNVYDRDGLTPLMRACRRGEKGIGATKLLIENGADVNALAMPKQDLRTPLHYAVLYGSASVVKLLIKVIL